MVTTIEFRRARHLAVLIAPLLLSAPGNRATAATINSVWNGGSGNWHSAAQWNPAGVPNNTATNVFNVLIDGGKAVNSAVALDLVDATIQSLRLSQGDSLGVNGRTLTAAGGDLTLTSGARLSIGPR